MAQDVIEQADAFVASASVDELHVDLQSLIASYKSRRDDEDQRGARAFAQAIVRRAVREGYEPGAKSLADMTAAELKAEVERRNEGRDEADRIVPEGTKKADLLAALVADDPTE
jgi:hypothetical protein